MQTSMGRYIVKQYVGPCCDAAVTRGYVGRQQSSSTHLEMTVLGQKDFEILSQPKQV